MLANVIDVKNVGSCWVLECPMESGIVYADSGTRSLHDYALAVAPDGEIFVAALMQGEWCVSMLWTMYPYEHEPFAAVFVADDTMTYSTSYSSGPEPVQQEPEGPDLGNYPAPGRWDWLFFWRR